MKSILLQFFVHLFLISALDAQCVLPSGGYSWGLTELNNHITTNCGGSLSSGLVLPTDASIIIQNNDVFDLNAYGAFDFIIQGNASLEFNGSDELIMASGGSVIIQNTSNSIALKESGVGTNIRITIGGTTFTGNQFAAIIAAGGVNQDGFLPVELISFASEINQQQQVELRWETLSEHNNRHFIIEHSKDGYTFLEIGKIPGGGNSIERLSYRFVHTEPKQGTNYYRLKQVDYDDNFEYLKTIVQEFEPHHFFELRQLSYSSLNFTIYTPAHLSITSISGQNISTVSLQTGAHELDLSELPGGQYLVRLYTRQEQQIFRIVR